MPDPTPAAPAADPVLVRRARIARAVSIGQRLGYLLFAVATVAFFVGLATHYTEGLVRLVVGCLFGGSAVLAPAIVFGYAVKAAEREDQGLSSGH
ncbi:MAG: hypothetical protein JWM89_3552 [Acidimicrobiales bacterium]|nr:hypothetical protein [Acidimicrobiales bacterium]